MECQDLSTFAVAAYIALSVGRRLYAKSLPVPFGLNCEKVFFEKSLQVTNLLRHSKERESFKRGYRGYEKNLSILQIYPYSGHIYNILITLRNGTHKICRMMVYPDLGQTHCIYHAHSGSQKTSTLLEKLPFFPLGVFGTERV